MADGSLESSSHDTPASSEEMPPPPSSLPSLPANSSNSLSLVSKPAMGLPDELWDAIFDFLSFDPYPLLACCSTCRSFKDAARKRLQALWGQSLDGRPENGRLIAEQIQNVSASARCIRNLTVRNSHKMASAVILAVPFQLSSQLTHLRTLCLENISDTSSIHPSVWPLFGHTVPSVSYLVLENIDFPSFSTFIQFVRSFHSLEDLHLGNITSTQSQVRCTFLRGPIRWRIRLLSVPDYLPYVQFMNALSSWFRLNKITFPELVIRDYPSLCQLNYQPIKSLGAHAEWLRISNFESSRGGEFMTRRNLGYTAHRF